MKKARLLGTVCAVLFTFTNLSVNAALVDNGGGLIYDTVLDITWSQPNNTLGTWRPSYNWAAGLTLGGVSGWRLPYISVAAGAGTFNGGPVRCDTASEAACQDNEMGYMFYHNLGGTLEQSILDSGDPDLALFPTLQSGVYWSNTSASAAPPVFDSDLAWFFLFDRGLQGADYKVVHNFYSWAVHDGNVVPVPAAVWLFASGFIGLVGVAKRRIQS